LKAGRNAAGNKKNDGKKASEKQKKIIKDKAAPVLKQLSSTT
jgi:hypothetical protein